MVFATISARMLKAEKRRLEKERKIENDAAKCCKMNKFFTVDISAQQQNEPHSDRSKLTTPEPPSPPENPVEIESNGPKFFG